MGFKYSFIYAVINTNNKILIIGVHKNNNKNLFLRELPSNKFKIN